jgi:hypothetical protein
MVITEGQTGTVINSILSKRLDSSHSNSLGVSFKRQWADAELVDAYTQNRFRDYLVVADLEEYL